MKKAMKALLCSTVIIGWAVPAVAQDEPAATQGEQTSTDGQAGVETIVVTARRKAELLQETPLAVTALTSRGLEAAQITDVAAIQRAAPNLSIASSHSGVALTLRGQVQSNSDGSVDQSVGLYVDGIYIGRQMGANFDLVDIERVEVLRGPQGTLFGRNTTGGAVSITTNKPVDYLEGSFRIGAGNHASREALAILNVPLVEDTLAVRVVARHAQDDGYGRNVFLDRQVGDDNTEYVRGSVALTPAAGWSLTLTGDYFDRDNNGPLEHLLDYNPAVYGDQDAVVNAGFYTTSADLESYARLKSWSTGATLEIPLGDVELKSITGYRGYKVETLDDFDTTPLPGFTNNTIGNIKQFSEELQLTGSTGRLDWIVGGFYFHEYGQEEFKVFGGFVDYLGHIDHKSTAVFAQVNYDLTDRIRLTGGLRYTDDERELSAFNTIGGACASNPALIVDPVTCRADRSKSNSYLSYTASADFQVSPTVLLYARTSMARKSGGINKTTVDLEGFDPEKITDYEVGVKADLLDGRLRVNAAAFLANYRNMQRPITSDRAGTPVALTQSIGRSLIPGGELEVTAVPIRGLELTGAVGIIDPEYVEFEDATGDRTDEPFTQVAELTWSLGGTWTVPAGPGDLALHADYSYQSRKYFFPVESARQAGYGILNARASYTLENPEIEIAVWAQNLAEKQYSSYILDFYNAAGVVVAYPGPDRRYGVSATLSF